MDGWMNGWMDGWMVGWLDGWMDGWMDGQAGGQADVTPMRFGFYQKDLSNCLLYMHRSNEYLLEIRETAIFVFYLQSVFKVA